MTNKEEVLKQVYENQSKTYGAKNKPRKDEPTMFQLLSWDQKKDEPWDFKKKTQPERENEAKKFNGRINHENDPWKTENMDNFRKIEKLDNQFVQALPEQTVKNIQQKCENFQPSPQKKTNAQNIQEEQQDFRISPQFNPKNQTVYRDNFQVKQINNHNDLMQQLEQNSKNFKPKIIHEGGAALYYDQPEELIQQIESDVEEEEELVSETQKKMNTKFQKSAKILDLNDPEDKKKYDRRIERIKKFSGQTRWLPDSAFVTYFGKPAWGAYGQANVKPTVGGIIYGQHMLSHNIQPHRQRNDPQYVQSYLNALRYGANVTSVIPEPPRNCREEDRLNEQQLDALNKRNPLTATTVEDAKKQTQNKKGLGGIPDKLTIKKPDLINTLRFASEHGSDDEEPKKQKDQPQEYIKEQPKDLAKEQQKTQGKEQSKDQQKEQPKEQQKTKAKEQQKDQQKAQQKEQNKRPQSAQPKQKSEKTQEKKQDLTKTAEKKSKKAEKIIQKTDKSQQVEKKVTIQAPQQELDDSLAIPDKAANKFMQELKQKKEKANRLTMKINEVNPSAFQGQQQKPQQQQPISKDLQDVKQFDDMNPPAHYLQSLDPVELNPKYYKGVPADWLHRIPYAGQKKEKDIPAKDCLDFGY